MPGGICQSGNCNEFIKAGEWKEEAFLRRWHEAIRERLFRLLSKNLLDRRCGMVYDEDESPVRRNEW